MRSVGSVEGSQELDVSLVVCMFSWVISHADIYSIVFVALFASLFSNLGRLLLSNHVLSHDLLLFLKIKRSILFLNR